jgi:hypothetical protein
MEHVMVAEDSIRCDAATTTSYVGNERCPFKAKYWSSDPEHDWQLCATHHNKMERDGKVPTLARDLPQRRGGSWEVADFIPILAPEDRPLLGIVRMGAAKDVSYEYGTGIPGEDNT